MRARTYEPDLGVTKRGRVNYDAISAPHGRIHAPIDAWSALSIRVEAAAHSNGARGTLVVVDRSGPRLAARSRAQPATRSFQRSR